MAIVEFGISDLESLTGKKLSRKDLEEVIPMMGSPLEKIDGSKVIYEVFPDRPDMLSVEGFARAVRTFLGHKPREYCTSKGTVKINVDQSVRSVRPFLAAAVVKDIKLTTELVESLMQVQEKLHETLGRKRKKVAIGIHDLDKVKQPFTYKAVNPGSVSFVPLGKIQKMSMQEICKKHEKGMAYSHILNGHNSWPVIVDSGGDVVSFPPIINGELTKVTMSSKNLFIDVTGTSQQAVEQALNIVVTSLADRGGKVETVDVQGTSMPDLSPKGVVIHREYVNKLLDIDLTYDEITALLSKMGIGFDPRTKKALVPAYRTDVMHEIDLVEDMAIAHGYQNFEPRIPKVPTIAERLASQEEERAIRELIVGLGFQEVKGMILSNENNQFERMNMKGKSVVLANSVTAECTICRSWLIPSLMKVFSQNMHREYPQRIFELGLSVSLDPKSDTGASNVRKLAVAISGNTASYEDISSALAAFFNALNKKLTLIPIAHNSFITGRCAAVMLDRRHIGVVGEMDPRVLAKWGLERPVAAFEINTENLK